MTDQDDRAEELRAIAERLGLHFNDLRLLDRALTHASVSGDHDKPAPHYEALEFLGDAALNLAVSDCLFRQAPERTPGEYSRMRAAVVNRRSLARLARQLGLGEAVRLGKGEELAGGRSRDALLEDCLEAVVGAVYLDQGWHVVVDFVRRLFSEEMERAQSIGQWLDYKSKLQHVCQARHHTLPKFVVVRSAGPDHRKEFEVEVILNGRPAGRGIGTSKKEAEQRAARAALENEQ
jgi:ribonuclease-3